MESAGASGIRSIQGGPHGPHGIEGQHSGGPCSGYHNIQDKGAVCIIGYDECCCDLFGSNHQFELSRTKQRRDMAETEEKKGKKVFSLDCAERCIVAAFGIIAFFASTSTSTSTSASTLFHFQCQSYRPIFDSVLHTARPSPLPRSFPTPPRCATHSYSFTLALTLTLAAQP